MEIYEPKPFEIAGFDLGGWRQPDGKIRLGDEEHGTLVDNFPQEVRVCGAVYTLEYIKKNDKPGSTLEWGIYV